MERMLLVLLAYSVAATSARDYDYSGAPVPHYHFEPGNREVMPLDYDFYDKGANPSLFDSDDEKPRYNKDRAGFKDTKRIQRHRHVPNKYVKEGNFNEDELELEDQIPEFKSTVRPRKNNAYYRSDYRKLKYNNDLGDDIDSFDRRFSSSEESKHDYEKEDDTYSSHPYLRKNNRRKARRKPRDREMTREIFDEKNNEKQIDIDGTDRSPGEDDLEQDYPNEIRRSTVENYPASKSSSLKKNTQKSFKNEDEYFDMKRINGIKDKLPVLLGRTRVKTPEASSQHQRLKGDHHRLNRQDLTTISSDIEETNAAPTFNLTAVEAVETSDASYAANSSILLKANKTEPSLAEKSRLSILRKANKKISIRNSTWTTKPPVLMQVTQRMQTVVMVERLNANNKRSELKEITNESPSRIAKAKKLMRHKLVAGAKNIQELTDNWDDTVCEYIDVSLLENKGALSTCQNRYIILCVLQTLWLGLLKD